jgi:hypothetical protein
MSEIYNGENKPVHPETGWRLASVWNEQQTTGDYTVGDELIAYYEAPGTPYTAELTFYVTATGEIDGEWTAEIDLIDLDSAEGVRYAVDERYEFYDEPPAGSNGPRETSYEGGSYCSYPTLEEADAEARRMAMRDISWSFAHPDVLDRAEAV